jgi:hypothetical protein
MPAMSAELRLCRVLLPLGLSLAAACGNDSRFVTASLVSPRGSVVAGPKHDLLFIANGGEDTLQVATLGNSLGDLEFVRSAAIYFALRIEAGPSPELLGATPDGEFVAVLSRVASSVHLVDARERRRLRRARDISEARRAEVSFGGSAAAPIDLVSSPVDCGTGCAGRFFVSLAGLGSVLALDVIVEGERAELVASREYDVGGAPGALALDRTGTFLFVADTGTNDIRRIEVGSGTVVGPFDAGAPIGSLAVSPSGQTLVIGRPSQLDVTFLGDASGNSPAFIPISPSYAEQPSCVRLCSEPADACDGALPADRAICIESDLSIGDAGAPYDGLYLGSVPQAVLTLGRYDGDGGGQRDLKVPCGDEDPLHYTEFAAIAGLNGDIRFVGLTTPDPVRAALTPEIVSSGYCEEPALDRLPDEGPALEDYLAACPDIATQEARFSCVSDGSAAGVLIYNGQTSDADWTFDWEGVLPGLASIDGGGQISADGTVFSDVTVDFSDFDIRTHAADLVGDTLDIVTPARDVQGCRDAPDVGDLSRCHFERRIERVTGGGSLVLSKPLPPACFGEGGVIGYQVRATGSYIVRKNGSFVTRLAPDSERRFGLGGDVGRGQDVTFTLKEQLDTGVSLTDPNACDRYDEDGLAIGRDAKLLSRTDPPFGENPDRRFGFSVTDPLRVVRAGLDFANSPSDPIGRLPAGMTVGRVGDRDVVFVTYTGSNSLLAFDPFDAGDFDTDYELLTR